MSNNEKETLDLSPSKEVYQAVKSDVTPISAIKELIDNALDNWERVSSKTEPLHIDVEYRDDPGELVIRDDSGGVEPDEIGMLFALGASKKGAIPGAIGAYGIGAKKAIVNLGREALIKSRHINADHAVGFRVNEEWLNDESNWSVDRESFDDLDPGVTEIRISRLNIEDWVQLEERVKFELSNTYQLFLGDQGWWITDRAELSIAVDGENLTPPDPINWSFTPFDGLHPRRYENIDLTTDLSDENFPDTVYLNLTVGLLQTGDEASSGTDVFCQHRQVLRSAEDERAGYGELGIPTGQHKRLRVILEFETEGDAERLPWDTQKNDINPYNPLAQKAYDWVSRAVRPYFNADHEDVPQTFLRPYGKDSDFAANHGEIETYDYNGRKRVTDKADGKYPDISELLSVIRSHVFLRIYCTEHLKQWQVPAYDLELQRQFYHEYGADSQLDIDLVEQPETAIEDYLRDDGTIDLAEAVNDHVIKDGIGMIDDPDPGLSEFDDNEDIPARVQSQAEQHVFCPTLKNWQLPSYLYQYSTHVTPESTRPRMSETVQNPYEPQLEVQSVPEEGTGSSESNRPSDISTSGSSASSSGAVGQTSTGTSQTKSDLSEVVEPEGQSESSTELDAFQDEPDASESQESRRIIQISLTESQWESLCNSLDLPTNSSEETVIEALISERLEL